MAIVLDAEQCQDPMPQNGYWVNFVEGLGTVSYSAGISPLLKVLSDDKNKSNRSHTTNNVTAGGWKEIPTGCFKNGKSGTYDELFKSILTKPTEANSDIRRKVIDALPKAIREVFGDSVKWTDTLGEINLDRLFSGQRKFLRRRIQDEQNRPVIGLGVPIQANCNVDEKTISVRSIVCAIAVEILEIRGYSVEVYATSFAGNQYSDSRGSGGLQVMRIKRAGETMAQSTILNATSGWAFRTAIFGMIEYGGNYRSGLGYSQEMSEEQMATLADVLPDLTDFAMLNCYPRSNGVDNAVKQAIDELLKVLKPYI